VGRTSKLKVAIVSQPWARVVPCGGEGSLGVWGYEVSRRLARSCDVLVCAAQQRGQKRSEPGQQVRYQRFGLRLDRRLLRLGRRLLRFGGARGPVFASSLYYPGYAFAVALALRARRCNVAHIHNLSQFVPIIRALNPRIRIVLHMHCQWLTQLDAGVIARRLRAADAIIGCSHDLTDRIRTRYPECAARCITIFNGVDERRFFGGSGPKKARVPGAGHLLFVGRISPEKGVHVLLDAFALVIRRHPQAHLELVGDRGVCPKEFIVAISEDEKVRRLASFYDGRSYWSYLEERMDSLQLRDRVTWTGSVPNRQLVEHYRSADAVVLPSFTEALPMTLIEASAAETPVVASRVGGVPDIVTDGRTGVLVEAGDAGGLAEAICRLLSNGKLAGAMGKAGRRRVLQSFTWDRVAEGILQLYERICDGG